MPGLFYTFPLPDLESVTSLISSGFFEWGVVFQHNSLDARNALTGIGLLVVSRSFQWVELGNSS